MAWQKVQRRHDDRRRRLLRRNRREVELGITLRIHDQVARIECSTAAGVDAFGTSERAIASNAAFHCAAVAFHASRRAFGRPSSRSTNAPSDEATIGVAVDSAT